MVGKFEEFDQYQLAKHKGKIGKKKKSSKPIRSSSDDQDLAEKFIEDMEIISSDDEDDEQERRRQDELRSGEFTLKRLIRLLHIGEPVEHVMALLGKR